MSYQFYKGSKHSTSDELSHFVGEAPGDACQLKEVEPVLPDKTAVDL